MTELVVRASESQHWYYATGLPAYTVPSADGKRMVQPDIRHARKLGLFPGVSSIVNCAAKPGLTVWQVEQGIMSSLTLPRRPHEPDVEFIKRIVADSKEQAQKAAERGSAIHASLQGHYENQPYPPDHEKYVRAASAAIADRFNADWWKPEQSFTCELGYGGKVDLHGKSADGWIVLDFKTKEFSEAPSKENRVRLHWDEQAMQLAAYARGLGLPNAICANVFVSTHPAVDGLVHIHVWEQEELARGLSMFDALLKYWCAKNNYRPTMTMKEAA